MVQETTLAIAKQSKEHRYDPKAGSFKVWLMNMTRWRIGDAFRRRAKDTAMYKFEGDDDRKTDTLDRFADPKADKLEHIWDMEWKQSVADRAIAAIKLRVSNCDLRTPTNFVLLVSTISPCPNLTLICFAINLLFLDIFIFPIAQDWNFVILFTPLSI